MMFLFKAGLGEPAVNFHDWTEAGQGSGNKGLEFMALPIKCSDVHVFGIFTYN